MCASNNNIADVEAFVLSSIETHGGGFLPGQTPSSDDIRANLLLPILIDGLHQDEAALILSTLPKNAERLYLDPLDKGLSGSKVFTAKYDADGHRAGKVFVVKIGARDKIREELTAIQTFVSPHIYAIGPPVFRMSANVGLLITDYAGLSPQSQIHSLREHVRLGGDPTSVISRLLRERFKSWYLDKRLPKSTWTLEKLLARYLQKSSGAELAPSSWGNVLPWVQEICGLKACDISAAVKSVHAHRFSSTQGIVHGDLHCQNILVDSKLEPWPIDFAWCHRDSSPLLDVMMLECSLKFLVAPDWMDLRSAASIEGQLAQDGLPQLHLSNAPYATELMLTMSGVLAARKVAIEDMNISFEDYRKALLLLTWALRTHPGLNQSYILISMALLASNI